MVSSGRLNWILYSFFLVSGSYLYVTSDFRLLSPALWSLSVVALVPLYIRSGLRLFLDKRSFFYLFFFFFFGLISAFTTDSYELGGGALFILMLFFFTGLALAGSSCVEEPIKGFIAGFFLVSFLFLLISIFAGAPKFGVSYKGLTYNPNSFGGILATIIYVFCALSLGSFLSGDRGKGFFYLAMSAMIFGLALFTRSRASIGASFFAYFLFFYFYATAFFKRSRGLWLDRSLFLNGVCFLIIFVLLIFVLFDVFYYGFVEKMQMKAGAGDITDGRLEVWLYVLSNLKAFGDGRGVFEGLEHGAHSTYISLLGQYGWIPVLFFGMFCISNAFRWLRFSYRACFRSWRYSFLPFFSIVCFLMLSLFEGMMLKSTMFVFLFFCCLSDRQVSSCSG